MKPTPRQYQEAVERQQKITDYLIKEGYAENPEMAGNITVSYTHLTLPTKRIV